MVQVRQGPEHSSVCVCKAASGIPPPPKGPLLLSAFLPIRVQPEATRPAPLICYPCAAQGASDRESLGSWAELGQLFLTVTQLQVSFCLTAKCLLCHIRLQGFYSVCSTLLFSQGSEHTHFMQEQNPIAGCDSSCSCLGSGTL